MSKCYICKKTPSGELYSLYTFDKESNGQFIIGTSDESMYGMSIVVCYPCQNRIIGEGIKKIMEDMKKDNGKGKSKGGFGERLMMMLGGVDE